MPLKEYRKIGCEMDRIPFTIGGTGFFDTLVDFAKDQVDQQIDRYSLPFDVMRAIPFGTTIASMAGVPYVGPASMIQGTVFGDRTGKRLDKIFAGEGLVGKDGHGQRKILHGEMVGSGHWENFKKIGMPILGSVAALGAAYAGHQHFKSDAFEPPTQAAYDNLMELYKAGKLNPSESFDLFYR